MPTHWWEESPPGGRVKHRREDAIQDLVLAGIQDYHNSGGIGPAKHRMGSRQKNVLPDNELERKREPKAQSAFPRPEEGQAAVAHAGIVAAAGPG